MATVDAMGQAEKERYLQKLNKDSYGEQHYWDVRYQLRPERFEWYESYAAFPIAHRLYEHFLPRRGPILQVGVGSSHIQADMAAAGYKDITSIDYSPTCIQQLKQLHAKQVTLGVLKYLEMDAGNMADFATGAFAGVLDKGTLDSIVCTKEKDYASAALMAECFRVLRPSGWFLLVSCGDPLFRLPYIYTAKSKWRVIHTYCLLERTPGNTRMVEIMDRLQAERCVDRRLACIVQHSVFALVNAASRAQTVVNQAADAAGTTDGHRTEGGRQLEVTIYGPFDGYSPHVVNAVSSVQDCTFAYACQKPGSWRQQGGLWKTLASALSRS